MLGREAVVESLLVLQGLDVTVSFDAQPGVAVDGNVSRLAFQVVGCSQRWWLSHQLYFPCSLQLGRSPRPPPLGVVRPVLPLVRLTSSPLVDVIRPC